MENLLNHVTIVTITMAIVGIIILAKKTEQPAILGVLIAVTLGMLLYHTYIINGLPANLENQISQTYLCIAMDFLWLLISFLGYLWIDDIRGIKLNKKNYDNTMSWFWNKL